MERAIQLQHGMGQVPVFSHKDKNLLKQLLVFDAAATGRTDVIKRSIKNRVNLNFRDKFSRTPLIMAIRHFHYDIAKILLKGGADPNIQTIDGYTALFFRSLKVTEKIKL